MISIAVRVPKKPKPRIPLPKKPPKVMDEEKYKRHPKHKKQVVPVEK